MPRPTDWDALGVGGDPTPGDPVRIHTVATSIGDLGRTAREIDTAMETVLNKTGPEAFSGETAEALRDQISGRLRGFVQSIAEAFEWSSSALTTYADAMSTAQSKADAALDQGRGLAKDDPNLETLAATARDAGKTQKDAASAATTTLRKASGNIKSPVSGCAEFWEIFQWIAIALILPALIFGGPIALVAMAVNLTIFIKTAVDFAQGKVGALDLFLSALGLIAPTTRAVPIFSLIAKGFKMGWQAIKTGGIATLTFLKDMLTGIAKPFVALPSFSELAHITGSWTKAGGLWLSGVGKGIGQIGANVFKVGSLTVLTGIKGIPGFFKGVPEFVTTFGKNSAAFFKGEFGGAKWLRIFLPAEGDEIGKFGVMGAMKIALIDRGVFGKFKYGAVDAVRPTVQAVGSGVSHLPTPDFTPHTTPGLFVPDPPKLSLDLGPKFSDTMTFSFQAVMGKDALLDTPISELSQMHLGEWANVTHTPTGITFDVNSAAHSLPQAIVPTPPPLHIDFAGAHAQAGAPSFSVPTIGANAVPNHIVTQATDLVATPKTVVSAISVPQLNPAAVTVTPPAGTVHAVTPTATPATTAHPTNPSAVVATPPPTAAVTVNVNAASTVAMPPPATTTALAHTVPAPALPHLTGDGAAHFHPAAVPVTGHVPATFTGSAPHLADIPHTGSFNALDLLHTGPNPTAAHVLAPAPNALITGTAANIANSHTMATLAQHISVDLGPAHVIGRAGSDLTPPPATALTATPPPAAALSVPPPAAAAHVPSPAAVAQVPPPAAVVQTPVTGHVPAGTHTPAAFDPGALGSIGDKGKAPEVFTANGTGAGVGAAAVQLPPAHRFDAAMDLLDHGSFGRPAPLPHPVDAHGTGGPAFAGTATPGVGDKAFAGTPARTPEPAHAPQPAHVPERAHVPEPPHVPQPTHVPETGHVPESGAVPPPAQVPATAAPHTPGDLRPVGPPPRLTGKELDGAWAADSERIGALFGAATDPARPLRFDAWSAFTLARYDLGRLEQHLDDLRAMPGGPSSGESRAVTDVTTRITAARQQYGAALRDLREHGINPAAIDQHITDLNLRSLRDRPRLLGGAVPPPVIRVEGTDAGRLIEESVPLSDPTGLPHGLSVQITYRVDGVDLRLLDADGAEPGNGSHHVVQTAGGGLSVQDVTTGIRQTFDSRGSLRAETIPVHGPQAPVGTGIAVTYDQAGAATHHLTTGGGIDAGATVTRLPVPRDGFRVDRPAAPGTAATYQLFDSRGLHLADGHGIQTPAGVGQFVEFPAPGRGGGAQLLDAGGAPLPGFTPVRETDAAGATVTVRIDQNGADGAFVRHGFPGGAPVETGTPLRLAGGAADGRLVVRPAGGGAPHIELPGGARPNGVQAVDHPGGGLRVERTGGPGQAMTYDRFGPDHVLAGGGRGLIGGDGNPSGAVDVPAGGAARHLDGAWQPVPNHTVRVDVDPATGNPTTVRVTDTTSGDYWTHDHTSGALGDHAVMLHGPGGAPLHQFGVTRYPAPGTMGAAQHLALDANGLPLPHIAAHGTGWRITDTTTGVRGGEYRQFGADGSLTGQAFNVTRDGVRVPDRQFVLTFAPNARTWQLMDTAAGAPFRGAGRGLLHSGTVEVATDAGHVKLVAKPGKDAVEIFEHRPLPTGGALDSLRRTDAGGFGRLSGQNTRWTQTDPAGNVVNWGLRNVGTLDGKAWRGLDHSGVLVHEFRKAIDGGSVLGIRDTTGDGWTWVRYDAGQRPVLGGVRTLDADGGWTDHLWQGGENVVVQRQWGPAHLPQNNAGHYREAVLDPANGHLPKTVTVDPAGANTTRQLWKEQSEHGKPTGALEKLPDNKILETHRWSEQRPPQWVRKHLIGIGDAVWDAHGFLKGDTRFQMSTWTKTDLATGATTDGFRFTAMNENVLDIAADGTLTRAVIKLDHGNTLTVGDCVALPAGAAPVAGHLPWTEGAGKLSGYRVRTPGGAGGRIWEDRFKVNQGGDWYTPDGTATRVARAGYADGTIVEFRPVPAGGLVLDGGPAVRSGAFEGNGGASITRTVHGAPVGDVHSWPNADLRPGNNHGPHTVTTEAPRSRTWDWSGYNGRTDTRHWAWDSVDGAGNRDTGFTEFGRGFSGSSPFDDSFRAYIRTDDGPFAIRGRDMLGGGDHVDAWRITNADGTHQWQWAKYDTFGNAVDYRGTGVREWWNPRAGGGNGAYVADWFPGARSFRDRIDLGGGAAPVTVREVPTTSTTGRVREYLPDGSLLAPGAANPVDRNVWKEFDHNAAVVESKVTGHQVLTTDAWRGQWVRHDGNGVIHAQGSDSGYIFEADTFGRLRLTGRGVDFRGPAAELRGWGRRIREANRMQWKTDLDGMDISRIGDGLYQPQWKLIMEKAAIEFFQEFILEFTANLAVNAIVADIQNRPFSGKDALKAFANASVSAGVKTAVGTLVHENRFSGLQRTGDWRNGLANTDSGKPWYRKPMNHDKHWSNEWAGNETPIRWRGGTYDFTYSVGTSTLAGWVNGSMNAAVFGITDANGNTVYLSGGAAALDGLINAASAMTGAVSVGAMKNLFIMGGGSRFFHRQGFAEFFIQFGWKIPEKVFTSQLTNWYRDSINPWWYQGGYGDSGADQQAGQQP
ncbi:putative T7SS-secreted protein [Actinacidiphila alni]|uniref:putative T7SS-secreted protein n=1 Tax=Actinacidiphila alni TaxID=380248 RepID=UPI0033DD73AE